MYNKRSNKHASFQLNAQRQGNFPDGLLNVIRVPLEIPLGFSSRVFICLAFK